MPDDCCDYKKIFNLIPDQIIILDLKGKILEVNEKALSLGYSREELIGKNIMTDFNSFTKETKEIINKNMVKHFSGEKTEPYEIEMVNRAGKVIPLEIEPQIITFNGQKADMVVLRDISRHKEEEKKYKRRSEEMEKMNQLMVGRELKMAELKKEIEKLKGNGS